MDPRVTASTSTPQIPQTQPVTSVNVPSPVLPQTEIPLPQAQPVQATAPVVSDPQVVASQTDALAQPLMQSATTVQPQPVSVPGKSKEAGSTSQEVNTFVEVVGADSLEMEPLPPEVSSWMEKVNRDSGADKLPEVVVADKTAQKPTGNYASQPVFVLPLGEVEEQQALHKSVENSVRWLAEWCKRVVKRLGTQVVYNKS